MRIGVDLGGSKIEIIVLGDDGDVLLRERVATPQGDYAATLAAVAELVEAAEKESALAPRRQRRHRHPRRRIARHGPGQERQLDLPDRQAAQARPRTLLRREVRLANDANCFALSEAVDGAGAGAPWCSA
jgi:fructokinase